MRLLRVESGYLGGPGGFDAGAVWSLTNDQPWDERWPGLNHGGYVDVVSAIPGKKEEIHRRTHHPALRKSSEYRYCGSGL